MADCSGSSCKMRDSWRSASLLRWAGRARVVKATGSNALSGSSLPLCANSFACEFALDFCIFQNACVDLTCGGSLECTILLQAYETQRTSSRLLVFGRLLVQPLYSVKAEADTAGCTEPRLLRWIRIAPSSASTRRPHIN